jgi:hypothetical protein
MRKFLYEMVTGTDNRVSSKRVITLIAFVLCAIAFVCNIFLEIPLRDYVWEGMLYLVGAGLGFSTVEHFANRKDRNRHRGNHQYNHYRNDNYDEDDYNEDDCDEDKDHRGRKNYRKNN